MAHLAGKPTHMGQYGVAVVSRVGPRTDFPSFPALSFVKTVEDVFVPEAFTVPALLVSTCTQRSKRQSSRKGQGGKRFCALCYQTLTKLYLRCIPGGYAFISNADAMKEWTSWVEQPKSFAWPRKRTK